MRTDAVLPRLWSSIAALILTTAGTGPLYSQQIDYFPGGDDDSWIIAGPDGLLWHRAEGGLAIGRITTAGERRLPNIATPGGSIDATVGPDGNVWYTSHRLGRITPEGVVTEFDVFGTTHITAGPDGNLWATDYIQGSILRVTPAGQATRFPVPGFSDLRDITAGPDGNLWFTNRTNVIGRITPAGVVTTFGGGGFQIASGPDGNVWYTQEAGSINRITPAGQITSFPVPPTTHPRPQPRAITAGADGNVWFTGIGAGLFLPSFIGRISPNGELALFPTFVSFASAITSGPDGNIWFATDDGQIGRLRVAGLGSCLTTETALCLNNFRFRVEVSFRQTPSSAAAPAQAVPLTEDSGAFWFFQRSNLELMVKVLDGRTINGRFWVIFGSLSNVEFTVTVTDTQTGATRTYTNPQGQLASVADTSAF